MSYLDVLDFPVNFVTKRDVLSFRGLRKNVPNVVLRHDYDSLENWERFLEAEWNRGIRSSNYLLMNKYEIPLDKFKEYEQRGFEFGLHQSVMDSSSLTDDINRFLHLDLKLTTMTPHGWANEDGEYPSYSNWEIDRFHGDGEPVSMNAFYKFCHEHFGSYATTFDVARYYSHSGKSFFEVPYRGVMLLDDSGNFFKPYTVENVLEAMQPSKVYVFLFHPSNWNQSFELIRNVCWDKRLRKKECLPKWMSRMEWDNKFLH